MGSELQTLSAFAMEHERISKSVAEMFTPAFGCSCVADWLHSINIFTQFFQDVLASAAHLPQTAWWSSDRPKAEDCIGV